MENSKLVRATFLARPNRFLAYVMVDDHFEKSCIKTARLFEDLFVPGKTVFLRYRKDHSSYDRYTPSDIVAVWHEGQIIYLDQDIPKRVTIPFLNEHILFPETAWVKKYCLFGDYHYDFRINNKDGSTVFVNVLPVSMEHDGNAIFPDGPSKKYCKKVRDIIAAAKMGQETCIIFVIMMKYCNELICDLDADCSLFSALFSACELGVKLVAYRVDVEKPNMEIIPTPVPIDPFYYQ